MGLGIQPTVARATYPLNCLAAKFLPRRLPIVLTYHRVGSRQDLWPGATGLAECTAAGFAEHMRWLREHCTPIRVTDLDEIVNQGRPCPNRAVLVSFDDGYRADMERVRPALEETGIRPVMFLPTDFIGTRHRFWWDRVCVCVNASAARRLVLPSFGGGIDLPLDTGPERDRASDVLVAYAKQLPREGRAEFLLRLEQHLGVASTAEADEPEVVSWDEVRDYQQVFDFGAHTATHPLLSRLSFDEIREELVRSRAEVERQTGRPCVSFAIPFGTSSDYTPEAVRAADAAGLHLVFSLENTMRAPQRTGGAALVDRTALHGPLTVEGMAAKVTWPEVFIPDWTRIVQGRLTRLWAGG